MHIAIDTSATFLTSAGASTYIRGLIQGLRIAAPDIKITEIACKPLFSRRNRFLRIFDTLYRELIWINFILPVVAKKAGAEILHCPAMMAPYRSKLPIVLSILDIYVVRNPRSFPFWQRTIMGCTFKHILESAAAIISISEFTKSEIHSSYPSISLDKITPTLLGVESIFLPVTEASKIAAFKKKHSITTPFILSVSTIEPRKNLRTLLESFAAIKDTIPHQLLLIGPSGWSSSDIPTAIKRLGITERVRFTGFVDSEELRIAYSIASVFVYISLYEGFGLPPLEAMACGCPVITSNVASMPEVVGDAAIMVNPLAVREISALIACLLENLSLRASLVKRGTRRACLFAWEKCAKTTLQVYKRVLDS